MKAQPALKDLPARERPREKLIEKGAHALSDKELLAILLGSGTRKHDVFTVSKKPIAIIDQKGVNLTVDGILDIDGIGPAKATLLTAAFEFVRRRIKPEGLKITFPPDILPLIQHYGDRKQEHFLCISINGANEVLIMPARRSFGILARHTGVRHVTNNMDCLHRRCEEVTATPHSSSSCPAPEKGQGSRAGRKSTLRRREHLQQDASRTD